MRKGLVNQERWPNQGLEETENAIPEAVGVRDEIDRCTEKTQEVKTAGALGVQAVVVFAHTFTILAQAYAAEKPNPTAE